MIYWSRSRHEAGAVSEAGRAVLGGQRADREAAAAGGLVVVWVVEVDTDRPLSAGSPPARPRPLGCAVSQHHSEVILKCQGRSQLTGVVTMESGVLTLLQVPSPMSSPALVTWLWNTARWLL